jgi:enolase
MTLTIQSLSAWEILDSRGRPTIAVQSTLSDGSTAIAQVPSGASTGVHEALELRDGDPQRYHGKGVRKAVAHVEGEIAAALRGQAPDTVDAALIALDGTPNKSRLGANALLGVSCATARALAQSRQVPLWQHLAAGRQARLPVPMINIFSGGHHAGHNIEFQDFLALPTHFDTYSEALSAVVDIHGKARELAETRGYHLTGVADEGGWGPALKSNEEALEILTRAVEPYRGRVAIALDVASSHFYKDGLYHLKTEGRTLDPGGMIDLLAQWTRRYPVISIEDGLAEDDWSHWPLLTARLGERAQLIGDDFFTTNPHRVRRGIAEKAANAVLVKMNQIGTLTETFEVIDLARSANWRAVISARSGETEDSFLADLAIASGMGQIKVGSITRSERLAKYNRLLEIEKHHQLEYRFP